jgi:glucose-1-phosphate adenylyltransferase
MSLSPYAFLLAGGVGARLCLLSEKRAKPAVPFGAKYRIIDFTLSNCVNSGIFDVNVLTQYRPISLHQHIGNGRAWDLDRTRGGVRLLAPYRGSPENDWYRGTADAVYQNLIHVRNRRAEDLLVLSGDHIYKMDYNPMLEFHRDRRAAVTIAVTLVPLEEASQYGMLELDSRGRVVGFEEKPEAPRSQLASMGVYAFRRDVLWQALEADAENESSAHDFGKDVIPALLAEGADVYGYLFPQYWQDVGTTDAFYAANLDLLSDRPQIDLSDPDWVIHTTVLDLPAVRLGSDAKVERSLVANGARIEGRAVRSLISPGVVIERGAEVVDSILMNDTRVLPGARIERAILDKQVWVGQGARIEGGAGPANRVCPDHLHSGLTLVGKGATIPERIRVGANARIDPDVMPEDFEGDVGAGEVVWNPRVPAGARSHGYPGERKKAALPS